MAIVLYMLQQSLSCVPRDLCLCRFEDVFPGTPYDTVLDLIGGDYEVRRWVALLGCGVDHTPAAATAACSWRGGLQLVQLMVWAHIRGVTAVAVPLCVFVSCSIKLLKPGTQGGHFAHVINSGFVNQ